MPTAGTTSAFTSAINEIKRTPRGQERTMYGPIRDLFVDILGYPRNQVRNELSAEVGVPDLTVQADSGMAGLDGAPILIPWIVVEAKDEPRAFLNLQTRESIVREKAKYITPDTAWFVLIDPTVIVARPVQSARLATVADLVFLLNGTETETKFQEMFGGLHAERAGVSPLLTSFRDGDETLIATEKLTLPSAATLQEQTQVLLAQRHFFYTLRQATKLLQGACLNALHADLPVIEDIRDTVAAFEAQYHGVRVTFDPVSIRGAPQGPEEARAHDREAAKLRRKLASQESLVKLALRDLEEFRARSGAQPAQVVELFAIETGNLLLARVLLIRFFEDHGFFQEKRYVCNGGVKAFREMMSYFDVGYTQLLERAYREAGSFYAAAFDETELDWVFEDRHPMLNHAIEWAMFQLSRYNFTTIKGDILNGIYDRFLDPKQRKRFGEYYTLPSIARYIIDAVEVRPGDRILDPACGSGTFLIETYQALAGEAADRGLKTYEDALEVLSGLAGNDLNTFSAVLTQIQLLWHLLPFKGSLLTEGFPDLAITEKFNSPALKTIEGEATRFAEIDQPIYDAVVGNPPYVRPERNTQVYDGPTLNFYARDISVGGNLYSLFIYRALKTWCRSEDNQDKAGRLGFIIPLSFCL